MPELFLERGFDRSLGADDVRRAGAEGGECRALHRVHWHGSLLSLDGHRLLCRFSAADAESVRIALRQFDVDVSRLWPGRVCDAPGTTEVDQASANVLVERRFAEPVALEAVQAAEDAFAWCLDTHQVAFLRTCFSDDGKRMICLYRAPDAESVRLVQRQAQLPFEQVWPFIIVHPDG